MTKLHESPLPLFDTITFLNASFEQRTQSPDLCELTENIKIIPDYKNTIQFLSSYRGSDETYKSYRREVERLLHWTWFIQKKSLPDLRRHDIEAFIEFCQSPPNAWIGLKNAPRFIEKDGARHPNPAWRPFIVRISKKENRLGHEASIKRFQLSQHALQAMFAILSSFFNYLEQEDYLFGNPVTQIRQKSKFFRKFHGKRAIRRLSDLQWSYVLESAMSLASEHPAQHERTLFIMKALYAMYLRVSELSASRRWTPEMQHFYKDQDGNWWFKTVGKGNKERDISVSDEMLNALKRYRLSRQLTPLPSPGESIPLIEKYKGNGAISSSRHIRKIVQDCFDHAIQNLSKHGLTDEADELLAATVHWLRHTGISDDVKIRPREHVRDDAGHSSSAITDQYIDIELRARHDSAKNKKMEKLDD